MTLLALTQRLARLRITAVQQRLPSATTRHATASSDSKRPWVQREVEVAHAAVVVRFPRRASRLARRSRSVVRIRRVTISCPCEAAVLAIATRTVARETCRFFLWIISNSIITVIDVRLQPIIVKCCLCVSLSRELSTCLTIGCAFSISFSFSLCLFQNVDAMSENGTTRVFTRTICFNFIDSSVVQWRHGLLPLIDVTARAFIPFRVHLRWPSFLAPSGETR